ncbi:MAG: signal peptide peptidase SppA [Bacteroidaceae bacterium]|nr:signal peptide peptidase SppA [Bacteroidaceae bacterium]
MKDFLKTIAACFIGILMAGLVLPIVGIIGIAIIAASSESTTTIVDNSVLYLDFKGVLMERAEENPFASLMGNDYKEYGLDDILATIKEAKEDSRIKGIYLQAGIMEASSASLEEIRHALADFKESGKFIVAYGDQYSQGMYYIASIADKVIVNPQGSIAWHGLASQPVFYKELLEKIGLEMQIFKVGTYKSAVEPFIATEMSDANREQVSAFLNESWGELTKAVSISRGISVEKLNEYADALMDLKQAEEYITTGLADTLLYKDGVLNYLKHLTGTDKESKLNLVKLEDMNKNRKSNTSFVDFSSDNNKIALFYAFGAIDDSTSPNDGINSEKVIKELRKLREDKEIKAVVLRVNSPGGSAYGSEQIWNEVVKLKAEKPVIVSMGDYAASGGYYISCAADCIVANPTTLTGSIGIFGMFPSAEKLLTDKLGLHFDMVKTNKLADMGNLTRKFNDSEKEILQNYINNGYALFLKRCADGRGMTTEQIAKIAEGRVWTGLKAKEIGLVDELGNLDKAIEIAAQKAGLTDYKVATYPAKSDFMTKLMEEGKDDYMETMITERLGEYYNCIKFINNVNNCDPIQARMPFELVVR